MHADDIDDLFAADGALARAIPGFARRAEQVAMAHEVAHALRARRHCVIEAGTGVGKTYAYLIPAMFAGRKIIVSTGTRTLQDQLFHRDLPTVTAALGRPVRVAMLKGRANYLCLHRMESAERSLALDSHTPRAVRRRQMGLLNRIRQWSLTTRTGEIAELAASEDDPLWPAVTSTRENCLGVECPVFQRCHVVEARRKAQAADVVVVNHHLLMADLLLKERGFGDLLPGVEAIVVDEAHQLPEVAEQFLGFAVSTRQIEHLVRDVMAELQSQRIDVVALTTALARLPTALAEVADALQAERCDAADWPHGFVDALQGVQDKLAEVQKLIQQLAASQPAFAAYSERTLELCDRLETALQVEPAAELAGVRWATSNRFGFSVHYAPIDVSAQLGALLEAQAATWVFTSATLAVAGDFGHFLHNVGLSDIAAHCYGSPFDFPRQALLYLPTGLDDPASPMHSSQVIEAALKVLRASGGRAFLLFTSHRALQAAARHLRMLWSGEAPYPLLVQGDAPRDQLLQKFREAGNAVLLGTGSFWEGVDVKGAALSVVIIDKLPFAVPDEPAMKARLAAIAARGGNPFLDEQVPKAVLALKQGVGRLIRDTQDFGVVMLCDRRLVTRPYGQLFLRSLPPMPRTERLAEVQAFLREKLCAVGIDVDAEAAADLT